MNPDASTVASRDILSVDLVGLKPAEQRIVHWRNVPVFVTRRTSEMLAAMQEQAFVACLVDRQSRKWQQPRYATNWHRSIDPAYAVLVGVCTYCACVPRYFADAALTGIAGGYACPCCAARYDPAGRAYDGIAQYNLPVPPYDIDAQAKILLGKNPGSEFFSLQSVERM